MSGENNSELERESFAEAPDRRDESGDAAEPDAPTSAEQNEAHSTILSADPVAGVQADAGEE